LSYTKHLDGPIIGGELLEVKRMNSDRIKALEEKIADLKARWPEHSVPMSMELKLEELEEELEAEKKKPQ
tara:strand:+ start:567 stop:776 length:210 start_codon:yes stop_codon:yes gene_type:complete